MTPHDDWVEFQALRDHFRTELAKTKVPYIKVDIYNLKGAEANDPMSVTAMNFEMLINSLLASHIVQPNKEDSLSIDMLTHVSQIMVDLCILSQTITRRNTNAGMNEYNKRYPIPNIFTKAFEDEDE